MKPQKNVKPQFLLIICHGIILALTLPCYSATKQLSYLNTSLDSLKKQVGLLSQELTKTSKSLKKLFISLVELQEKLGGKISNPTKMVIKQYKEELEEIKTHHIAYPSGQERSLDMDDKIVIWLVDQKALQTKVYKTGAQLLTSVPGIGIYGNPYQFRKILLLMEINPEIFKQCAPESLLKAIPPETKSIDFHVTITGDLLNNQRTYNTAFHGFISPYFPIKASMFVADVPMGIFNPSGVEAVSINLNNFKAENVHVHDFHFSPSNACIKMSDNRQISTMWSAAYTPANATWSYKVKQGGSWIDAPVQSTIISERKVIATYHLFLNNLQLQNEIATIIQEKEIKIMLEKLEKLANEKLIAEADQTALKNFVQTLYKIIQKK